MKPTHADFRPGKRPRFVPSGKPRRKLPLIRIALLIGVGLVVYARFDDYWPHLRKAARAVTPWSAKAGVGAASAGALEPIWARDSSRVTLACASGLESACCATLESLDQGLCGEAQALLAKARWKQRVSPGRAPAGKEALLLEARAIVSDLGDWGLELSGLRGSDVEGVYLFRRAPGLTVWCDAARGCLRDPLPRIPLSQGHLQEDAEEARHGGTSAQWISDARQVLAVLPGHVVSVDSTASGITVKVYHGREIYAEYGPLQPAPGVRSGAPVKAGSHLGDVLSSTADPAGMEAARLTVRIVQAGQPRDPAAFWGIQAVPGPAPESVDGEQFSGAP